jgi:hypothetical protein
LLLKQILEGIRRHREPAANARCGSNLPSLTPGTSQDRFIRVPINLRPTSPPDPNPIFSVTSGSTAALRRPPPSNAVKHSFWGIEQSGMQARSRSRQTSGVPETVRILANSATEMLHSFAYRGFSQTVVSECAHVSTSSDTIACHHVGA